MADPTHRLIELTGFGRRGEDVSDAAADRPLEQIGGQLIGDQDGPHVRPAGEQVLGTAEARLGCGRGSQHEHHGDTGEALIDPPQVVERGGPLAELHGDAAPDGRIRLDHDNGCVGLVRGIRHGSRPAFRLVTGALIGPNVVAHGGDPNVVVAGGGRDEGEAGPVPAFSYRSRDPWGRRG